MCCKLCKGEKELMGKHREQGGGGDEESGTGECREILNSWMCTAAAATESL